MDGEGEAQPVAREADEHPGTDDASTGKVLPQPEGESDARAAREQTFRPCDRHRITQRQALGEIVVDGPAETGSTHGGHAEPIPLQRASLVAEDDDTQEYESEGARFTAPEVLPVREDGEGDRERRLQVQQERRGDGGQTMETGEQEHGAENAAHERDRREQPDVGSS